MLKSPWLSSFSSTPHKIHSTILLVLIQNTTSIFNYFLLFSLILLWFKILLTLSLRLLWQPPKWFFCFHLPLKSSRVGPQNCDQTGYSFKKKGGGKEMRTSHSSSQEFSGSHLTWWKTTTFNVRETQLRPHSRQTLRGLRQTLCTPGLRDPTETETKLCLSISCGGVGQQWTSTGTGALGVTDLDIA